MIDRKQIKKDAEKIFQLALEGVEGTGVKLTTTIWGNSHYVLPNGKLQKYPYPRAKEDNIWIFSAIQARPKEGFSHPNSTFLLRSLGYSDSTIAGIDNEVRGWKTPEYIKDNPSDDYHRGKSIGKELVKLLEKHK